MIRNSNCEPQGAGDNAGPGAGLAPQSLTDQKEREATRQTKIANAAETSVTNGSD